MFKVRKIIYFLHFSQTQVSHLQSAPQLLQLHPSPQEFWVSEKDKKKIGNEYVKYLLWPQRPEREKNISSSGILSTKLTIIFFIFKKSIEGSRIYNYDGRSPPRYKQNLWDEIARTHCIMYSKCGLKILGHTAPWTELIIGYESSTWRSVSQSFKTSTRHF